MQLTASDAGRMSDGKEQEKAKGKPYTLTSLSMTSDRFPFTLIPFTIGINVKCGNDTPPGDPLLLFPVITGSKK